MEIEFGVNVQAVGSEVRGVFSFLIPLSPGQQCTQAWRSAGHTGAKDTGLSKRSKG